MENFLVSYPIFLNTRPPFLIFFECITAGCIDILFTSSRARMRFFFRIATFTCGDARCRMVGIMADEEYTASTMYNNNHMSTFEEGYDSEEEFLDNTQFEDPPDFVDTVDDEGTYFIL